VKEYAKDATNDAERVTLTKEREAVAAEQAVAFSGDFR
jgi:hypothetical protein